MSDETPAPTRTTCGACKGTGDLPVAFDDDGRAMAWMLCGTCKSTGSVPKVAKDEEEKP